MNDNSTLLNITDKFPNLTDADFSSTFKFWFLLIFHVPSIICYFFVLTYIFIQKTQRQALHNHSVIILLLISLSIVLFDYSWSINAARRGGEVWPPIPVLCEVWWLLDFGFYDACTVVLAWASFERHILIFHSNLVATKRRLGFIHYLPLIIILLYLIIFYTYTIFFPPCQNKYDFSSPICGAHPCYISISYLAEWSVQAQLYLFFFSSLIQYLLPFLCLTYFPEIWQKIKTFFIPNQRRVMPADVLRTAQSRRQ